MTDLDLEGLLDAERAEVDRALERAIRLPTAPAAVADPIRYAVRGGGKRVRPILCVVAYRAFRPGPPPAVYDLGSAIELIHAYSLVHDDLPSMDDDDVRRGRPSTHVVFGASAAAVAGAALIPLAVRVAGEACRALDLEDARRGSILRALCEAAGGGGMVGGQVLDLEAEQRRIESDELEEIHRRKTGALLSVAPWIGATAAGAPPAAADAVQRYGSALGLAFQIADDILDVTATTAVLGKTAGRDGALNKSTFAVAAGVEGARTMAGREVDRAVAALEGAGIRSEELVALARFSARRDH